MRVLVVHNHYRTDAPSGERSVLEQETAGLRERGHEVALFERHNDDIAGWSALHKAALPTMPLVGGSARRALQEQIEAFAPDVIHLHNLFPLISAAILADCAQAGVPLVATIHNYKLLCARGDFFRGGAACHECAGGHVLPAVSHACYHGSRAQTAAVVAGMKLHRRHWRELVSAYIFISRAQKEQLAALGIPEERSFVKHNFVPPGLEPGAVSDHQVAYVGRLEEEKGVGMLMRAWDQFRAGSPRSALRLALVGGGPMEREVSAWAQSRPSVDVHGLLPRDSAMAVLARSRCAVLPSLWQETFGLVAVECMALGVPPLAASHGSFPEIVTPGVDGRLFDAWDPSALADLLVEVDRDPEEFARLGKAARATYERDFHRDRNLDRLLEIYDFAVRRPAVPAGPVRHPAGAVD